MNITTLPSTPHNNAAQLKLINTKHQETLSQSEKKSVEIHPGNLDSKQTKKSHTLDLMRLSFFV